MRRYKNRISRIVTVVMLFVFLIGNSNMVHAMEKTQAALHPCHRIGILLQEGA